MSFRFIPDNTSFDFIGKRHFAYMVTLLFLFGTAGLLATRGLNFGIDFTGGTLIEIATPSDPDLAEMRVGLNELGLGDISIQEFGEPRDILIRLPQQQGGPDAQKAAINSVRGKLDKMFTDGEIDYRRTEFVGPQVGKELKKDALLAVLLSLGGILVYLWIRFEWQFAVAAIAATAHDVFSILGLFALTRMQFDLSTLAAVLLVAGYSINDTVVVFDRIRENMRKFKKTPMTEILNMSVNQTLSRTLLTSGTTLLALGSLWVFGGEVIAGFVNALVFGIMLGTFSSIYVVAPTLLFTNLRPEKTEDAGVSDDAVSEAE